MEELLSGLIGRRIDVVCIGGSNIRGEVVKVSGGVLYLKDEDQTCYVAIDKISVVWEAQDELHKAGFVSSVLNVK